MSHQCSCGRDLNNNYVSYTNAYANANLDRESNGSLSASSKSSAGGHNRISALDTACSAKVIFGTVGAIKELREKEKTRHASARAGERRN